MKKKISRLTIYISLAAAMAGAASCTRKIYMPAELHTVEHVYTRDSTRHVFLRADTLLRHDSILVQQRGDTVYHTSWHVTERIRHTCDTIYLGRMDTIQNLRTEKVAIPQQKHQRKTLKKKALAITIAASLIMAAAWHMRKKRRRTT